MAKKQPRGKNKDNSRRAKKRISPLTEEKVEYVDYKDVVLLRRFMSDRAKIRARRVTGNSAQQQREVANAIKNAREMALLAYTNRVTTQRGNRDRDRDRAPRAEGPPPKPSAPPPPPQTGEESSDGGAGPDPATSAGTPGPAEAVPAEAVPADAMVDESAGTEVSS